MTGDDPWLPPLSAFYPTLPAGHPPRQVQERFDESRDEVVFFKARFQVSTARDCCQLTCAAAASCPRLRGAAASHECGV